MVVICTRMYFATEKTRKLSRENSPFHSQHNSDIDDDSDDEEAKMLEAKQVGELRKKLEKFM